MSELASPNDPVARMRTRQYRVLLVLLTLFKGLARSISLGSFRGGPTFPATSESLTAFVDARVGAEPRPVADTPALTATAQV